MNDAKYIGLDVHQATISAAVRDSDGKLVLECNRKRGQPNACHEPGISNQGPTRSRTWHLGRLLGR